VEPTGELRLASGSYKERAKELGLVFHAKSRVEDHFILDRPEQSGQAPGKDSRAEKGVEHGSLPPGFVLEDEGAR
jgi:hypothetical protein